MKSRQIARVILLVFLVLAAMGIAAVSVSRLLAAEFRMIDIACTENGETVGCDCQTVRQFESLGYSIVTGGAPECYGKPPYLAPTPTLEAP